MIWKHLALIRQRRSSTLDEIDTWQPILERDLLSAQMLLDGKRMVGAAFDRRVISDHHDFLACDLAYPRDYSRGR